MGSYTSRQTEVDVIMDLNEQGQEQLGVDAPYSAHAAVDGQELTQATGCLQAEGRCWDVLAHHLSTPDRGWTASLKVGPGSLLFSGPAWKSPDPHTPGPLHPSSWLSG